MKEQIANSKPSLLSQSSGLFSLYLSHVIPALPHALGLIMQVGDWGCLAVPFWLYWCVASPGTKERSVPWLGKCLNPEPLSGAVRINFIFVLEDGSCGNCLPYSLGLTAFFLGSAPFPL